MMYPLKIEEDFIVRNLTDRRKISGAPGKSILQDMTYRQLSLFDDRDFAGNQLLFEARNG